MTDDIKALLSDLRYLVDRHLSAQQSQGFWQAASRSQDMLDRIDAALAGPHPLVVGDLATQRDIGSR